MSRLTRSICTLCLIAFPWTFRAQAQITGTWPRGLLVTKDPQTGYVEAFEYLTPVPVNQYTTKYTVSGGLAHQIQNSSVVENLQYPPSATRPAPQAQIDGSLRTLDNLTRRYPQYATLFATSAAKLRTIPTQAAAAATSPVLGSPTPGTIASLTLRNGTRYQDFTVLHADGDRFTIRHQKGIAEVPFRDLPADANGLPPAVQAQFKAYQDRVAREEADRKQGQLAASRPTIVTESRVPLITDPNPPWPSHVSSPPAEQDRFSAEQSSVQEAQRQAESLYPELSIAGSETNSKFVGACAQARLSADPILSASDWPLILAIRVSDEIQQSKKPPVEKKPLPEGTDAVVEAAKKGDPEAQLQLGQWYFVGRHVPRDTAEGAEWWRKAALQGNGCAADFLGDAYAHGYINGIRAPNYALEWFTVATENGYVPAMRVLAMCYGDSFLEIVQPNRAEAYKWLSLAAALGSKDDSKILLTFQTKMTSSEIKDGIQKLAEMISHKAAH